MNIQLSASMSCANPLCYRDIVLQLDQAGLDSYHFDICDGHFAPTFLLFPGLIKHLRPLTSRRFDVHLYCTHPSRYLDELISCGADVIITHVEAKEDPGQVIQQIKHKGGKAGLAILPGTPIPANISQILPEISLLMVNMVGPAYAGQPFDRRGAENLARLSDLVQANNLSIEIGADGNVSVERLPALLRAGCTHLVCGTSSVFKPGVRLTEALRVFRRQVEAQQEVTESGSDLS